MTTRSRFFYRWPALALVATGVTLGSFGVGLGNGDHLVARGFATALESGGGQTAAASRRDGSALVQLSGSEEFWLNHNTPLPGSQPVVWVKPLAPGDRITISSGGRDRVLDVIDIQPVNAAGDDGKAGKAPGSERLLVVTCRDPEATGTPVRFVIEGDGAPAGQQAARAPRTL